MKTIIAKREKAVTLIALVITIIILLILASVAIYSGREVIESSKLTVFSAEMKIMQTYVNDLYDKDKTGKIDKNAIGKELEYNPEVQQQVNKVLITALGEEDTTGYRYYDQETITELGIEGVRQEFFVNIDKRKVVSYKGLKYEGQMYYTLEQLPDGLYNIDYEPETHEKPTFDLSCEKIEENKWRITVSNIQYDGYINKWTVRYKLEENNYEKTSEDLSFIVTKDGIYSVAIENGEIKSDIKEITANDN